jgi:hypothetical protein
MIAAIYKYASLSFRWLLLIFVLSSFSSDQYNLIKSIPFSGAVLTTDNLGNAYVIVANQLLEFDPMGKPKANYSENNHGILRSVDASNPLKLLLFYPDFAQINILNNKLSLQSTVDLRPIGILLPTLICNSNNDGYWVFDQQDFQLKKIDLNLQVKIESGNITQSTGYNVQPNFLLEKDYFVYLNNPETGILVFDMYGTYFKTIPFKNIQSFQIIGDELLYVENNKLISFNLKKLEEKEILLPLSDSLLNARIEQKELFLLTTASLNFYSF